MLGFGERGVPSGGAGPLPPLRQGVGSDGQTGMGMMTQAGGRGKRSYQACRSRTEGFKVHACEAGLAPKRVCVPACLRACARSWVRAGGRGYACKDIDIGIGIGIDIDIDIDIDINTHIDTDIDTDIDIYIEIDIEIDIEIEIGDTHRDRDRGTCEHVSCVK